MNQKNPAVAGPTGWHNLTFSKWSAHGVGNMPDSQEFDYDDNGNREYIKENETQYDYSIVAGTNRLQSTAGPTAKNYIYDAVGNIESDGLHTYQYDAQNRLVSVDFGTPFEYNGLGQRVRAYGTDFVYDELGQLISDGEYETIYFGTLPVATVLQGTWTYYIHADHLNTPRQITNINLQTLWRWDSDPFGSTPASEDANNSGWSMEYYWRFPGQYYESATGLHYNYFRDYDPMIGRFVQSDPIGLAGGLNTFGYVNGSPLMYSDPLGLDWTEDWQAIRQVGPWDAYRAGTKDVREARKAADRAKYKDLNGKVVPLPGEAHGFKNAFTHCVWLCLMTQRLGATDARILGQNHEEAGQRRNQRFFDKDMDLFNNDVGCMIGKEADEDNQFACSDGCMLALIEGQLRVPRNWVKDQYELVPTDVTVDPVEK